jgi:hypothetical protein
MNISRVKKTILLTAGGLVLGYFLLSVVVLSIPRQADPDTVVRRIVVDPLPSSMKLVKTIIWTNPTLGDGVCHAAYSISEADCDQLIKTWNWRKRDTFDRGDAGKIFSSVWSSKDDLEIYYGRQEFPSATMIVSKDHTKIVFLMSH